MLDGNLSALTNFTKVSPYTKADTANAMPINQHRQVTEIQNSLRSKEYVQKQNKVPTASQILPIIWHMRMLK